MLDFIQNNWWQLLMLLPFILVLIYGFFVCIIELFPDSIGFLIIVILAFIGVFSIEVKAETYQYSNGLKIEAPTYKQAAKLCFARLTNGIYPGEERGMDFIDICTNPKKGNILK